MKLVVSAVLLAFVAWGQKLPSAYQAPPVAWKIPSGINADDYAGIATCSTCHVNHAREFGRTPHATAAPAGAPVSGCEACHGPGKAHATAMRTASTPQQRDQGKKLIFAFHGKPSENAARCLTCHSSSPDQRLFERSEHKLMGLSCEGCHSAHLVTANVRENARKEGGLAQSDFFSVVSSQLFESGLWGALRHAHKIKPSYRPFYSRPLNKNLQE